MILQIKSFAWVLFSLPISFTLNMFIQKLFHNSKGLFDLHRFMHLLSIIKCFQTRFSFNLFSISICLVSLGELTFYYRFISLFSFRLITI